MYSIRDAKNAAHLSLAVFANIINGFPGKLPTIIGVTGTDGKTTTSLLLYHILNSSGKKAAVISTVGAIIGDTTYNTGFHVTTPSSFTIQRYLRLAFKKGCTHIILEVTSHALDQHRAWGIQFDVGILTNITHEHLDYHKTYSNYVKAKLKLLTNSKIAIVNSNGEWMKMVEDTIPSKNLITYSLKKVRDHDVSIKDLPFKVDTNLLGEFNMENILAASIAAMHLNIDSEKIANAIKSFTPPKGRQDIVENKKIKVMIDFAHTPNSFLKILPSVKKITKGRLIHVFGSAGKRDVSKRPEMGNASAIFSDVIVLTAEDPRNEEVTDINRDIESGILQFEKSRKIKKEKYSILDREEAIKFAVDMAKPGDTVIITGKGHEESMNINGREIPWSDHDIVNKYLSKK